LVFDSDTKTKTTVRGLRKPERSLVFDSDTKTKTTVRGLRKPEIPAKELRKLQK
jgi:hypothetical protein